MYRQRGLSLWNMMIGAMVLGFGLLLFFKLIPAYTEYFGVKAAIAALSKDMAGAPPSDIRTAFDKRATIEGIVEVKGADLDISPSPDGAVSISVAYDKDVPLLSNVSLRFHFEVAGKPAGKPAI